MQRHQLEHTIRAAAGITGAEQFVIIGSQAVLGQFPRAPEELLVSIEADVSPGCNGFPRPHERATQHRNSMWQRRVPDLLPVRPRDGMGSA